MFLKRKKSTKLWNNLKQILILIVGSLLGNSFSPISLLQRFTLPYLFSCIDGAFQLWEKDYTPDLVYILETLLGLALPPTTRPQFLQGYQHGSGVGLLMIRDKAPCTGTPGADHWNKLMCMYSEKEMTDSVTPQLVKKHSVCWSCQMCLWAMLHWYESHYKIIKSRFILWGIWLQFWCLIGHILACWWC